MASIVNLAVQKIGELLLQEAKFLHEVEDEVKSMQNELIIMNSFLIKVEADLDESGDKVLCETAKQIRNFAYDIEDVIDAYILGGIDPGETKKGFFKRYLSFCECLVNTHKTGTKIENMKRGITQTMERLKRYSCENGFKKVEGMEYSETKVWRQVEYPYARNDQLVIGLDEDIQNLAGLLTAESNDTRIQVLSIVGMGGSGKTTLARKLFDDESVKQCFDSMTWISISQQWTPEHDLRNILIKIRGESVPSDQAQDSQVVGEKIYKYLNERKYLIVLDDVWTNEAWKRILTTLPMGKNGSKVIVTTRKKAVVGNGDPTLKVSVHEPRQLTTDESWELFRKIVLWDKEETMEFHRFSELGKEMLKKCKGLPLAIIALAGVLASKKTPEEWERVNMAISSWVMEAEDGEVEKVLSLSYNDLPRDRKSCFLHLGLFPEDTEIPIGLVIRMWIAEGFISSEKLKKGQTLEDLAEEYMSELIGRCLVRVSSKNYDGKAKTVEMHDLMRDLSIKKAKELDFLDTFSAESSNGVTTESQARRTIVCSFIDNDKYVDISGRYGDRVFCPFSIDNRHLRSLFLFATNISDYNCARAQLKIMPILENFKFLRVLLLISIKTSDRTLPKEMGSLILLRYLGLMNTTITKLPSSIGNLRNLLTLDFRCDMNLPASEYPPIPDALWEIKGLRHIYLPRSPLKGARLDTLQQLQTLWVERGSLIMNELPKLSGNVKKLHIEGIKSNEELEMVFQCPSIKSDRLHSLHLWWVDILGRGGDHTVLKNLKCIVNSEHLRKLYLMGRIDDSLDCFQFPVGIKKLVLRNTKIESEDALEVLGRLPNLMVLWLWNSAYNGTKWTCHKDLFTRLNELRFHDLPKIEEWSIEKGALCQLNKLAINYCQNMKRLPEGLKFITTLKELTLWTHHDYSWELSEEDRDAIRHIPVVRF